MVVKRWNRKRKDRVGFAGIEKMGYVTQSWEEFYGNSLAILKKYGSERVDI